MAKVLATDVHLEDGTLLPAGSSVPKRFADQVTNPAAYVEAAAESEDDESADDAEEVTVKSLKAALKERDLPTSGTKDELAARLKAAESEDDESADQGNENQE